MANPIEVTDADFQQRVLERSAQLPVLVDFWADWCQPCHMLAPVIEQAVDAHAGKIELAKLDTDNNQATAARYGMRGLPTVKAFRNGEVVDEFTGAQPPLVVERFVAGLVPSEADELVGGGDEQSLRRALEVDPGHATARRELGKLLLRNGEAEEALTAAGGPERRLPRRRPGRARPAGGRRGPRARLRGLGRAATTPTALELLAGRAGRPRAPRRDPPRHGGDLHRARRRRPAGARIPPAAVGRAELGRHPGARAPGPRGSWLHAGSAADRRDVAPSRWALPRARAWRRRPSSTSTPITSTTSRKPKKIAGAGADAAERQRDQLDDAEADREQHDHQQDQQDDAPDAGHDPRARGRDQQPHHAQHEQLPAGGRLLAELLHRLLEVVRPALRERHRGLHHLPQRRALLRVAAGQGLVEVLARGVHVVALRGAGAEDRLRRHAVLRLALQLLVGAALQLRDRSAGRRPASAS